MKHIICLLFISSLAHANDCMEQFGRFNFQIERQIDQAFYMIKTNTDEKDMVSEYIARAAVILTGGPLAAIDAVITVPIPETEDNKEYTKEAILVSEFHLQSVPERLQRIGHGKLNNREFDLWGLCQ